MHGGIVVQLFYQGKQLGLGRVGFQLMLKALHADVECLLSLTPNINLAGRIFTDKNNSEARCIAGCVLQLAHMGRNPIENRSGKVFAVDNLCGH